MKLFSRILLLSISLFLAACGREDPPTDAPTNLSATGGESFAVLNWDVVPGRTYWAFYKAGSSVSQSDFDNIVGNIEAPAFINGLDNGTQYAFTLTSSLGSSPVGPFSTSATATPRLLSPAVPWTVATPLTTANLNSTVFANDQYIVVGDSATVFIGDYEYLATEPGFMTAGISAWTQPATLPIGAGVNLTEVVFDGTRYVALGDDGSVIKTDGSDSLTWEAATAITTPPTMNALAVGLSRYVAVGNGGAIYSNNTDGATAAWSEEDSTTTNDLYAVRYISGRFIVVGATGTVLTSTDGVNWTMQTAVTANALRQVSLGLTNFVAVGDAGTIITSTDTLAWTTQTNPTAESFRDIVFGVDGQHIAIGTNGTVAYSETGDDGSWTIATEGAVDLNALASNAVFLAVGDAGANVSGK